MSWHTPGTTWRKGPWSLQLREDEFADVAFEGRVALRSIRAVVRDRDWDTAALVIDDLAETEDGLLLNVHTEGLGAHLTGTVRTVVARAGLSVELELLVQHEFWTNRVGLVVLHPPEAAGADLRVRHSDGTDEATRFPTAISPHQPVFDITELEWARGGLDVDVRFEGDVFEMEDQRNWSDASFKTYSRPLGWPFPYVLDAGSTVRQRVEVRARAVGGPETAGETRARLVVGSDAIELGLDGPFPDIAVGAATAPGPAPAFDPFGQAVLVELDLASPNWRAALDRAAATRLPLDVRFILSDAAPSAVLDGAKALRGLPLARVAAFAAGGPAQHVSDAVATASLREALAAAGVEASVVGGTRSHFTELNREQHRLPRGLDGVVFSTTPLFHSRRTEQLVESLTMQRLIAQQAVAIAAGVPVHIGPVTLRPRFNNVATTPPPMSPHADLREGYGPQLLDADDDRQDAAELAAWTIASAAALAVPGVASLTYFEEWGPRGIRSADGADRPVAGALRALAALHGTRLLHGSSPDGLVWAIGGASGSGEEAVLVANLDRVTRAVEVRMPGRTATARVAAGGWVRARAEDA